MSPELKKAIINFETLYDYDFDDYKFQEDSRKREQKDYEKKPYRGSLYLTWARLMIDDSFSYGVLSMVAGYLYCQLDEYGNDYMEKLIPHKFTHGKNHGKAEGPGYLFDIKIDAKGLESQLDELKHRFWKHISEVHERLMDEFDKKSKQLVFILNQSQVGDPSHHFLFTDQEILKRIHFKTFFGGDLVSFSNFKISCPVRFAQRLISSSAAGSSASTFRICPTSIFSISSFVIAIGMGQ